MTLGGAQIIGGFACAGLVIGISIKRGKFGLTDSGNWVTAFMAGFNIPMALFLCYYYFIDDPPLAHTKLHDVAKYISLAGFSLLVLASVGIFAAFQTALKKPSANQSPT